MIRLKDVRSSEVCSLMEEAVDVLNKLGEEMVNCCEHAESLLLCYKRLYGRGTPWDWDEELQLLEKAFGYISIAEREIRRLKDIFQQRHQTILKTSEV